MTTVKLRMGRKMDTVLKICFLYLTLQACIAALPVNCISYCSIKDTRVIRCQIQNEKDYINLRRLPRNTRALECLIVEPFQEEYFSIQHLALLQSLTLRPRIGRTEGILSNNPGTVGIKNDAIFQGLSNLTELGIHVSLDNINASVFGMLTSLSHLDLSNAEGISSELLRTLLRTIGQIRPPLVRLNLTRVNVRNVLSRGYGDPVYVKRDIYEPLQHITTLKTLDVRNNGFVGLQGGLTQFLPQLEEIYLGQNVFTFYGDSNLCTLIDGVIHPSLKKIYLSFVAKAVLRVKKSIREQEDLFDIFSRNFKKCFFSANGFCGVINCMCSEYFTVPCSNFSDRYSRMLIAPPEQSCKSGVQFPLPAKLERLTTRSLLVSVKQGTGNSTEKENYCFMPDNKLMYADMSSSHLDFSLRDTNTGIVGLNNLVSIILEYNGLDLLKVANVFQGEHIKRLFLAGNFINVNSSGSEHLFRGVPKLEVLDLSRCQLSEVPEIGYLEYLQELDLSQNRLSVISVKITSITLRKLNLSQNILSSFHGRMRDDLDTAAKHGGLLLDLTANRILCQCHTEDFISWMHSTKVQFADNSTMLCTYMNGIMMSPWDVDVDKLRKECSNFYTVLYSVLGCLTAVMVSSMVALLYTKKWTIRFWLHTARETWRKRRDQTAEAQGNRYLYDVFVAYSSRESEEREWVHLTLVPKLENEHGMRACIHHRDFMPGRDICDNIVDAINGSRKTLLILSPNFLSSDWCNFEVRMARAKLIEDRRDSIVLLLYKQLDVAGGRIPKKLTKLLEKKTYAEWTEDVTGQRLFWNKLVLALQDDIPHPDPYDGFDGSNEMDNLLNG